MEEKSYQSRNISFIALIAGVLFFISTLSFYAFNFFDTPISDDPNDWGVLGDFIGGLVNPLLGLVTIWLLTVSLRQNNQMLEQARKELKATLEELKRGQEIQASTERALNAQIELARSSRDLDGAIKLVSYWQERHDVLIAVGHDEATHLDPNQAQEAREAYNKLATNALKQMEKFEHILASEEKRLLDKYPINQTSHE
jgi:uncharacterized membrane protein